MIHIMGNGELLEDGIPPVDHSKLGDFDSTVNSLEAIREREDCANCPYPKRKCSRCINKGKK